MSTLKTLLGAGAVASVAALAAPAFAQTPPSFTVNPSAVLGSTTASGPFTANQIGISDFSTVTYTGPASTPGSVNFTDVGFLPVTEFQSPSGAIISDPKLNVAGGYGLYFQFNATGTQTTTPVTVGGKQVFTANFTGLNYTLYAFDEPANATSSFSSDGKTITPPGTNTTALASGTLGANGGTGTITNNVPDADVFATVNILAPNFFVSPTPFYLALESSFVNNTSEVAFSQGGFTITQGGGSVTFNSPGTPVPEPATLGLLGFGLAALGLVRRRRG